MHFWPGNTLNSLEIFQRPHLQGPTGVPGADNVPSMPRRKSLRRKKKGAGRALGGECWKTWEIRRSLSRNSWAKLFFLVKRFEGWIVDEYGWIMGWYVSLFQFEDDCGLFVWLGFNLDWFWCSFSCVKEKSQFRFMTLHSWRWFHYLPGSQLEVWFLFVSVTCPNKMDTYSSCFISNSTFGWLFNDHFKWVI